jgi:hypothetical protein
MGDGSLFRLYRKGWSASQERRIIEGRVQIQMMDWETAGPPRGKRSEILALIPKDSTAVMDADFARDVEAAIESYREPVDASKWD